MLSFFRGFVFVIGHIIIYDIVAYIFMLCHIHMKYAI